jgi:DNA polymerase III epsilon subunit-like protein
MERHHRALSDAVAASELLALINEKRVNEERVAE